MINNLLSVLAERLGAWIPMCGRIIAVSEDSGIRDVERQEVPEPHLPIVRHPRLLPVAVEAVDSDNASKAVFQNAKIRGSRKNPSSLYLRVHPCGQQFQTKPVIVCVVGFDIARLQTPLSTHES
jgi:hypothetical protein